MARRSKPADEGRGDGPAVVLLDGAMGSALRARGVTVPDHRTSIWSAMALMAAPGEVERLHADYIAAGADVITANTYAVTPNSLARAGLEHRLEALLETACGLADDARRGAGRRVRVAGSLPPLAESYRPDLVGAHDDLLAIYRRMAAAMRARVDLVICETMTTGLEASAAARAGREAGLPVWVSFALDDTTGNLRGGERVGEAVAALSGLGVSAFLINCSSAHATRLALPELVDAAGHLPVGVYINPYEREPPPGQYVRHGDNFLDSAAYAREAGCWRDAGAGIIGGCCGTTPDYIAALGTRLRAGAAGCGGT